jgi:dTDP-4-amino-4,6-dideoxygalactose transaminase
MNNSIRVPLVDLRAQYKALAGEIEPVIRSVLQEGQFILGEGVRAFETEFAIFCGAKYAIGTASGTAALHLALLACGVGPGDEVITTPFTFIATCEAISYTGAQPVFVDITDRSYTLDPNSIERAITSRTKAILPVHLYGHPADLDAILSIAKRKNLAVIEDAAQAHAATYHAQHVGTLGNVGCFSFYPGKNLGACGDGGIVITNDEKKAEAIRMLRDHGRLSKYEHLQVGYCYRLDAIQAAILQTKMKHLDEWTQQRRRHAEMYKKMLANCPAVVLPEEEPFAQPVYHLFVIRTRERPRLLERLRGCGIGVGIHYPIPIHLQPAYRHLGYSPGDFPVAERCAAEVLSLPMYPELQPEQIQAVVSVVSDSF